MTGTASSQVRSAAIVETTPGTIPSTPAWLTSHRPYMMNAGAEVISGRSLVAGGARLGQGLQGLPVTGTWEGPIVYGELDVIMGTLLQGSFSTDVMKDGKLVKTIAVENQFPEGVGGTSTMVRYRGVEAVSGSITLKSNAPAMASFNLVGRGSDNAATSIVSGATYTDPTQSDPLSSGVDVGTITMAGYTPLPCMESLEISFAFENREAQNRIGSNDLCGITRGDFLPVLTARFYMEDDFLAIYNAARALHSVFSVDVPIGSVTGQKYLLDFKRCNFGPATIDMSGASLMHVVQILPEYSAADSCILEFTRGIA